MLEDEILTINGYKINNDLDSWVEYFKDDQIELTISRKGRVVNVMCPNTNKSYFPIYTIEKAKSPSNLQKRVFKKWCSCDWDEI
jgi:predicted metalloprotease with PDZ domain